MQVVPKKYEPNQQDCGVVILNFLTNSNMHKTMNFDCFNTNIGMQHY